MNKLIAILASLLLFFSSQATFAEHNSPSQKIKLSSKSMTMDELEALVSSAFIENTATATDLGYEIQQRKEERSKIKKTDELLAIDAEIEVLTNELKALGSYDPKYIEFSEDPNSAVMAVMYPENYVHQSSNYETFEYVFNQEAETYMQALDTEHYEDLCSSIENLTNLLVSNILYADRFNKSTTKHHDVHKDYQAILKGILKEKDDYKEACHFK